MCWLACRISWPVSSPAVPAHSPRLIPAPGHAGPPAAPGGLPPGQRRRPRQDRGGRAPSGARSLTSRWRSDKRTEVTKTRWAAGCRGLSRPWDAVKQSIVTRLQTFNALLSPTFIHREDERWMYGREDWRFLGWTVPIFYHILSLTEGHALITVTVMLEDIHIYL